MFEQQVCFFFIISLQLSPAYLLFSVETSATEIFFVVIFLRESTYKRVILV